MLLTCPQEFRAFLRDHGRVYPYRDCLRTRKRLHVKWLLIEKKDKTEDERRWTLLPSDTFDNKTVTHLIVSLQALPVPPNAGEVLDAMYCWGSALDLDWSNSVIDYMGYLCWNGFELTREDMFYHCIKIRIDLMIARHASDLPFTMIMDDWSAFYKETFHYKFRRFSRLCRASFAHVKSILEQLDDLVRLMNTPVVVPVTPPAVVSS